MAICAALTAVGAFIRIPLPALSITMQVFFAMLAGLLLGPKWGAASQALYIAVGLLGLPIFSKGYGGPAYVLEPSFGYLLAFVAMAAIVGGLYGTLRKKGQTPFWSCCWAGLCSVVVVYVVGAAWLWGNLTLLTGTRLSLGGLLAVGVTPFVIGDVLSVLVLAWIGPRVMRIIKAY